jgi:hypothetical protein
MNGDLACARGRVQDTGCQVHCLFVFYASLDVFCFAWVLSKSCEKRMGDYRGVRIPAGEGAWCAGDLACARGPTQIAVCQVHFLFVFYEL